MAVKYFAEFEQRNDRVGIKSIDIVRIEISDVDYVGDAQELLLGAVPLTFDLIDTADNKLAPLKGKQYTMQFVTSDTFSFNDLFTDSEQKWIVTIFINGATHWKGFVIPDGCSEPFLDPPYVVSVKAIDGLGVLKNIKYQNETGGIYTGPETILNIFVKCLQKLGLDMNINTFCKLVYDGLDINDDPFFMTKLYQERYLEEGENLTDSLMCSEVIESILHEWVSTIVQRDGEWFIYRIPDFTTNFGDVIFRKYDSNGVFIADNPVNVSLLLGNNEGDVIHCNANQMRSTDFAVKSVTVNYEYGLFVNLLTRRASYFFGDVSDNFFDWTKGGSLSAKPAYLEGDMAYMYGKFSGGLDVNVLKLTNEITVPGGLSIDVNITFNAHRANYLPLSASIFDGTQVLYFGPNGWTTTPFFFKIRNDVYEGERGNFGKDSIISGVFSFEIPIDEATYQLNLAIGRAGYDTGNVFIGDSGQVDLVKIEFKPQIGNTEFISEKHEVINNAIYTTNKSISVLNGEGEFDVYLGTMLKNDETSTDGFIRYGAAEIIPFLTIAAQDILYQYGRPMNMYEGSVYGYVDALSKITINGLSGVFHPVNLKFDYKKNVSECTLIEIDSTPVPSVTQPVKYKYKEREQVSANQ